MAELTLGAPDEGDRGQLILVTGFALAFSLVAIVLLLNTTIFTENLASRGLDRSPDEAVEFRVAAEDGIRDLIIAANDDSNDPSGTLTASLANFSRMMGRSYSDRGTIANVNNTSITVSPGTILEQTNASRPLWNISEEGGDWDLARNVNQTRRVRFNLSYGNLSGIGSSFRFNLSDDDNYWKVHITSYTDGVRLYVNEDGMNRTVRCEIPTDTSYVSIDLSLGTVNGEECDGFEWWGGDAPATYDISFENSESVTGNWSMVILDGTPVGANFDDDNDGNPHYYEGVYSATVQLRYVTSTLDYSTNVTIAPGEPDP